MLHAEEILKYIQINLSCNEVKIMRRQLKITMRYYLAINFRQDIFYSKMLSYLVGFFLPETHLF